MKISPKTLGIVAAGFVGALVLLVVLFVVFFPKDLAAREAERRIEEATGRQLTLGQDIDITLWPALGFSVNDAALSNPQGFASDTPFLSADRIVFAVRVLPLLRGAIEVKELTLEGANVQLLAREDGAANWTFPTSQESEQQTTLDDLRLENVRLTDSVVSFQGDEAEDALRLEDIDASLVLDSLDAPARIGAAFDYRGERLSVSGEIGLPRAILERGETPLSVEVASEAIDANFDGRFNGATGALQGAINARGDSLRRVMAWVGAPMEQGAGFGAFRMQGQLAHAQNRTALSNAVLGLDAIEARGNLVLVSQENGRLRVEGALTAPSIDINAYMPQAVETAETPAGVNAATAWPTTPIDLSGLRTLDANLNLTLGSLTFQRMSFTDAALNLRLANGAADARLSRVSLYGGEGTARLIADGSRNVPRIAVSLDVQNVQAEPLLTDAIGFNRIAGRGRLTASLVGHGRTQSEIMRSLSGNAAFTFNDGQWKGVNLAQVARTVQAALTGSTSGPGGATDFAELAATFAVDSGVMATNDLRLLNPFVRLDGQGVINIGMQSIDMRLAPRAVRSIEGQGGSTAVSGIGIPFRVSGPWSNVRFQPALGDAVENELRARAQNILRRQDRTNPLTQLGEALFGGMPDAPATEAPATEGGATPPATPEAAETPAATAPESPPQSREDRAREALGGLLRNAIGGNRDEEKQEPAPAPTPTPAPGP